MRLLGVLAWVGLSFVAAYAQTSRVIAEPGAVILEPPTIGALGVEWPDLGALEFGRPLPVYGPRALANQP